MPVRILAVSESSSHRILLPGDEILAIGGQAVDDIIDFKFMSAENDQVITYKRNGVTAKTEPLAGDYLFGLTVDDPSFKVKTCANRCLFCFVEQLPPDVRKTLRIRDDDYRLSFLAGNYITTTNLSKNELERLQKLRLSPLYISVQATDPAVRARLMGNSAAGNIMAVLKEFTSSGVKMHTQLVLCPQINDGEILKRSLDDLSNLIPAVLSIAVVPAGTTAYQKNVDDALFTAAWAKDQLAIVRERYEKNKHLYGNGLVYASDEMYSLSGLEIPDNAHYEDYPQYENGIGIIRSFNEDAESILPQTGKLLYNGIVGLVCGRLPLPYLKDYINCLVAATGIDLRLIPVDNNFFGGRVSVSGLLSGRDVLAALSELPYTPDILVLPAHAVNHEARLIDDITLAELSQKTGVKIRTVEPLLSSLYDFLCEVSAGA
ncbi:MAG: DUF512 domain-containing protein [bacterium]|nr:DUF512 domain-containing protein [bacterium]